MFFLSKYILVMIFRHPGSRRYFSVLFGTSASQLEQCTFKRLFDWESAAGKVPISTENQDVLKIRTNDISDQCWTLTYIFKNYLSTQCTPCPSGTTPAEQIKRTALPWWLARHQMGIWSSIHQRYVLVVYIMTCELGRAFLDTNKTDQQISTCLRP